MRHLQDRLGVVEEVFGAGLKLTRPLDDRDHLSGQQVKSDEDPNLDDQQHPDQEGDDIKISASHCSLPEILVGGWWLVGRLVAWLTQASTANRQPLTTNHH